MVLHDDRLQPSTYQAVRDLFILSLFAEQGDCRTVTEAELRETVVNMAHALGWKVFSLPINRTVRPVKDAVGYPDLTLARNGRVLFIELKQEKGVLTDVQMAWMRELPDYAVVRPSDLDGLRMVLA